jgi:hypothetical protein
MNNRLIGIAVLAIAWQTNAIAGTSYGCNVNSAPYQGVVYEQNMTPEEEESLPRWNPETEIPAISGQEAIRKVRSLLEAQFPNDQWTLCGFMLHKYGDVKDADTWWYCVQFSSATEFLKPQVPFYFSIHITSDGWIPPMKPTHDIPHSTFGQVQTISDKARLQTEP